MFGMPQYTPGEPQGAVVDAMPVVLETEVPEALDVVVDVMLVVLETEVPEALGVVPDPDGKAANASRPTPRATITAIAPATPISFLYSDNRFTHSMMPGGGPYSLLDFRDTGGTSC